MGVTDSRGWPLDFKSVPGHFSNPHQPDLLKLQRSNLHLWWYSRIQRFRIKERRNMWEMISRCKKAGLKLNPGKWFLKQGKVNFDGITCSKNGIQPDPRPFLGMSNYMGPFIPNLNTLTAPLRELVTDKSLFYWKATYQEALDKIKESISNEVTFTYFDPKRPTVFQVDASLHGLGAYLLQDSKAVLSSQVKPWQIPENVMPASKERC